MQEPDEFKQAVFLIVCVCFVVALGSYALNL